MNTEADIVERLRKHVTDRGGASIENGAWQMMLDAAQAIERLRIFVAKESDSANKLLDQALDLTSRLEVVSAERDAAARDMRERCAKEAEDWFAGVEAAEAIRGLPLIATDGGTND